MNIMSRKDAKAAGLKRYFTGKPCRRGHTAERLASDGACVQCSAGVNRRIYEADPEASRERSRLWHEENGDVARERQRQWYLDNAEAQREGARLRREANPEAVREYNRRWREENLERARAGEAERRDREGAREAARETSRLWRLANPEASREAARAWREANPDLQRENNKRWKEENPEAVRANHRKRETRVAGGASGKAVQSWARAQPKVCVYCDAGCEHEYHIDHVIPLSKGGDHELYNLVIACPTCNMRKGSLLPEEFLARLAVSRAPPASP